MPSSESPSSERKRAGRKQYGFLYVALQDLLQARAFAQHILDQGWHFEPWETQPAVYLQQAAFTTALVVAYRRPFTEARNWPKFPQRLLSLSLEERLLHQRMDTLRNAVYAHSDSEARVLHPFKTGTVPSAIEAYPAMRLSMAECQMLLKMIETICDAIRTRLTGLIDEVIESAPGRASP